MHVLVLHSDCTIANLLVKALRTLGIPAQTEPGSDKAGVAFTPWNDWSEGDCRRMMGVARESADRVVILLEGGRLPEGLGCEVLPAPCRPSEMANLVRRLCLAA